MTVLALFGWAGLSALLAVVFGRVARRDPYPLFDPTHVDIVYGGSTMVQPQPLDRHELGRIVALFDPAALVGPVAASSGYVEVTFPDEADAWRFVGIARDGRHGATPFAADVTVEVRVMIGEESGPVTLGMTLLPGWRPAAGVAA